MKFVYLHEVPRVKRDGWSRAENENRYWQDVRTHLIVKTDEVLTSEQKAQLALEIAYLTMLGHLK